MFFTATSSPTSCSHKWSVKDAGSLSAQTAKRMEFVAPQTPSILQSEHLDYWKIKFVSRNYLPFSDAGTTPDNQLLTIINTYNNISYLLSLSKNVCTLYI